MVVRRRTRSAGNNERPTAVRDTRMLDAEVVDTLFQLDSVVTELERETLIDLAPSPLPRSSPAMARKISPSGSSLNSIEQPSPSSELSSSLDSDFCREPTAGTKQFPSPPRSRALPCVSQLKQQFMSPQRPSSAPLHREAKQEDLMLVRGNVKNIIAQMQTTGQDAEELRSLTPPFVGDQVKKRHSIAIQSKISEFNHQWSEQSEEKKERRKSQSYTPPAVRRKIQSPFLLEEFRMKPEETKAVTSTKRKTKEVSKIEAEIISLTRQIEELNAEANESEAISPTGMKAAFTLEAKEANVLSQTRTREEFKTGERESEVVSPRKPNEVLEAAEEPLPTRTGEEVLQAIVLSPTRHDGEDESLMNEIVPVRTREKSPMKDDFLRTAKETSPIESPTKIREKSPMREELERRVRELSPMMEELSSKMREMSPLRDDLPARTKDKSPEPVTALSHIMEDSEDLVSTGEEIAIHSLDEKAVKTSAERIGGFGEDQSKQEEEGVIVRAQLLEIDDTQTSAVVSPPSSAEIEKSSEDSNLVSFLVLSPPHKKSSKKKVRVKPPPPEVATPDDVELTFDENTSTSTLESDQRHEAPRKDSLLLESPHRVEVVIGVKENGIFTPPRIVEDDDKPGPKLSSQYDHLSARSQYDHLSPLEPGEDPYMPFQRHRSASDVASHHVRPLNKGSLNDELVISEVGECVDLVQFADISSVGDMYSNST